MENIEKNLQGEPLSEEETIKRKALEEKYANEVGGDPYEDGVVIPLYKDIEHMSKRELQEAFEDIRIKLAEEDLDEGERLELQAEANKIEEKLGLSESQTDNLAA